MDFSKLKNKYQYACFYYIFLLFVSKSNCETLLPEVKFQFHGTLKNIFQLW